MRKWALAALVLPAVASADPSFEVKDRGDAVEIIAHEVKAARTAITPVRSRLEVPYAGDILAQRIAGNDKTVNLVELDADTHSLSVKLNLDRPDVKSLARYAQAFQVGDDLHLLVPRKVPAEGEAVKMPEPMLPAPPTAATAVAAAKPIIDLKSEIKLESPEMKEKAPGLAPRAAGEQKAEQKPEPKAEDHPATANQSPTPQAPPVMKAPPPLPAAAAPVAPLSMATTPEDGTVKTAIYAALGIAAAGGGVWLLRKRKGAAPVASTIEVIAQRSLGGKARIVWIAAGPKEMIVAVTPQAVRMLGQWKRGEVASANANATGGKNTFEKALAKADLPPALALTQPAFVTGSLPAIVASPALAGLRKLRAEKTPPVNEEVATEDVDLDAEWAREILAATGRH